MNGSGPRCRGTDTHFTGELGMGTCHERGQLLMSDLHEFKLIIRSVQGAHDAVTSIPRVTKYTPDAPLA